ncbi:hypothetical protein D7V93_25365 [Corallococcus llansteffanensis]|uniref:Dickkopf N-terminal cysteine-rich domain-containing protein n=2 Tax=Corallococcus llansteffanensis TaxID=2316731 RepID=A0A3A8PQ07_9BACT|nr:hypothetical protein D7V93_25365 [Corallococcus llansteffanensis]
MRSFVVWGAVLFLACTSTPEGLCENDSGCLPGLRCQEGICAGCGGDGDCQAWEACSANRRCEPREGMCSSNTQCQAWEVCGAGNTCELAEGSCLSAADCKAHEVCNEATRKCDLQPGRCNTSDDCAGGSLWAATCAQDNQCQSVPVAGNDVLIWGTLSEGACYADAISSVLTPTRAQVGFGCYSSVDDNAVVSPSGRVHYIDGEKDPARLKVFVPDAFKVEGRTRSYPSDGAANDTQLPTPGCSATQDVASFVMQAGTGAIAYNCGGVGGGNTYYNLQGGVVASGHRLIAWNASDHLLASETSSDLVVLTPTRTVVPVTGLPVDRTFIDARARPTGFRLALFRSTDVQQLWHIDQEGVATLEGTYGAFPENVYGGGYGVLDSAGALHVESSRRDKVFVDVVVRRPADGSPGTIVYSEDSAPASVNYAANYEQLFNYMHISYLFAGP